MKIYFNGIIMHAQCLNIRGFLLAKQRKHNENFDRSKTKP